MRFPSTLSFAIREPSGASYPAWTMALLALEVPQQTSSSFSRTQTRAAQRDNSRAEAAPETPAPIMITSYIDTPFYFARIFAHTDISNRAKKEPDKLPHPHAFFLSGSLLLSQFCFLIISLPANVILSFSAYHGIAAYNATAAIAPRIGPTSGTMP